MPKDTVVSPYSSVICALSEAVDAYPSSPKRSLSDINRALSNLSQWLFTHQAPDVVYERGQLSLSCVENLINKQPVYDRKLAVALYEMADSFEQYALAWELGESYVGLTLSLFSEGRFCWRLLTQKKALSRTLPRCFYEARNRKSAPLDVMALMALMARLSRIDEVSFHLDERSIAGGSGYFKLYTAESLAWLKARFPNLIWCPSLANERSQQALALVSSYRLTFLSEGMPKRQRRRMLASLAESIKTHCYVEFAECFSAIDHRHAADEDCLDHGEGRLTNSGQLVPGAVPAIAMSAVQEARAIRVAGCYYAQIHTPLNDQEPIESQRAARQETHYLGRDLLSSLLYVVDTGKQWWAFDQADVIGCFSADKMRLQQTDSGWLCYFETGLSASLQANTELYSTENGVFHSLNEVCPDLFVIQQGGHRIAFAIKALRQEEGICAVSDQPGQWIKNIWLNAQSKPLIEPWFIECRMPSIAVPSDDQGAAKGFGYYQVALENAVLWVDANLVLDVISTMSHEFLRSFSNTEVERESALLYGMRYFNRIVLCQNEAVSRMVLLIDGYSLAFQAASFRWCESLPTKIFSDGFFSDGFFSDKVFSDDFSHLSWLADDHGLRLLGCHTKCENHFVINTNNLSNFIHYLWPQHSLDSVSNYD